MSKSDEEIIGTWGQIIRESDFTAWVILGRKSTNDAAIRLWRVAEKETTERIIKGWKPLLAEARASEQEKCNKQHEAVIKDLLQNKQKELKACRADERRKCEKETQWNKASIAEIAEIKKEAYAKGKAGGIKGAKR
jgi:hypothetical protein